MQVLRHSRLYESAAAYVTDQPTFLNAALAVHTDLPPRELLAVLKSIEVRPCPHNSSRGSPISTCGEPFAQHI